MELWELQEDLIIDALWSSGEGGSSSFGYAEVCSAGRFEETSLDEVCASPMDPVLERRLLPAREEFLTFGLGKFQLDSQSIRAVPDRDLTTESSDLQHGEHQGLVIRDRHFGFHS